MDSSFKLALILSAINNTGGAFGALQKSASNLQTNLNNTKQAASNLFNIGSVASMGIAGWAIKQGMQLQDTQMRMEVFLGSAAKAKVMLAELNDFANLTPYSNQETYDAANFLIPYYKDAKVLRKEMMMISDVASGMHAPFTEIAEKFARFKAQDVLHLQDIYEMTGRGFNLDYIAQALGTTKDGIAQMSKDGAIHFQHIEKAMQLATQAGGMYYQMTEKLSMTASGRLSTALGTAQYAVANATSKLLPTIVSLTNSIIPMIDSVSQWIEIHPELTASFVKIAAAGVLIYPTVQVLKMLYGAGASIAGVVGGIVNFSKALTALRAAEAAGNMTKWYEALEKYGSAGSLAAKALKWAKIEQIGFNMATLSNPYILGAAALIAVGAYVGYLAYNTRELTNAEKARLSIDKEVSEITSQKKAELQVQIDRMKEMKEGSEEWKTSIENLQVSYGSYLGKIDMEKQKLKDLPALYDVICQKMDELATKQAIEEQAMNTRRQIIQDVDAQGRLAREGSNWGDKLLQSSFISRGSILGETGYYFSNKKKMDELDSKKKADTESLTGYNLQAVDLAMQSKYRESLKGVPFVVYANMQIDGKTIATAVIDSQRVENRGSFSGNGK